MKNQTKSSSPFSLRGVGKQIAKRLAKLEIYSIQDLLFHLPKGYQDRTQIQAIRKLMPQTEAVIEGMLTAVSIPGRGKTKLLCELQDDTGKVNLRFFNIFPFQLKILKPGIKLRCFSEVRLGNKGLEMVHPEFQVLSENKEAPIDPYLTAIYPSTQGLSQLTIRKLMANALAWLEKADSFRELLPNEFLETLSLPPIKKALHFIHKPLHDTSLADLEASNTVCQKRVIFEELLAHRISLLHLKNTSQTTQGIALHQYEKLSQQFIKQLPFQLTAAQLRVMQEVRQDLLRSHPMLRLLQGDVGAGKTVIAAFAMLQAVESGYQAALMAPTELLTEQHFRVFREWFEPLGLTVVILTGSMKTKDKTASLAAIATGKADVILGSHALFQPDVKFSRLALVITDEQHRFGVHQRALFLEKGQKATQHPHQLIMTATPIPRTLAMSFYADLDCSIIDELPPGRIPIVTRVIDNSRRDEVIERVNENCLQGKQVYWVCPLIEESELIACQAATVTHDELQKRLPQLMIGLIHGRMSSIDKEQQMQAFQQGHTNVLVATTVIEVGLDVPNASVMIIENAERLGLAQLHQLRGRVGRGRVASHCLLLYQSPLSEISKERLLVMRDTTDGFKIAERDLELRGPGEILGIKQTGELNFKVADLLRDAYLFSQIIPVAEKIINNHSNVIDELITRWLGDAKACRNI